MYKFAVLLIHLSEETSPALSVSHRRYFGVVNFFEGGDVRLHVGSLESDKCAFVAHLVAVVWCTENGEYFASLLIFEALWLDFVRAHQHR